MVELSAISDPSAPPGLERVEISRGRRLRVQWIGRPYRDRGCNLCVGTCLGLPVLRPLQQRFGEHWLALVPAFPPIDKAIGPPAPLRRRRYRAAALLLRHRVASSHWQEPKGASGESDRSEAALHWSALELLRCCNRLTATTSSGRSRTSISLSRVRSVLWGRG